MTGQLVDGEVEAGEVRDVAAARAFLLDWWFSDAGPAGADRRADDGPAGPGVPRGAA